MTNKCPHCGKAISIEIKPLKTKIDVCKEGGDIFCQICSKPIEAVDTEIKGQPRHFEPEQIAWFSQREFGKNICWSCQNEGNQTV